MLLNHSLSTGINHIKCTLLLFLNNVAIIKLISMITLLKLAHTMACTIFFAFALALQSRTASLHNLPYIPNTPHQNHLSFACRLSWQSMCILFVQESQIKFKGSVHPPFASRQKKTIKYSSILKAKRDKTKKVVSQRLLFPCPGILYLVSKIIHYTLKKNCKSQNACEFLFPFSPFKEKK